MTNALRPIKGNLPHNVLLENLSQHYQNEFLSESDFRSLQGEDQQVALAEYALSEFVNTTAVVDALFHGKGSMEDQFGKVEKTIANNALFRELDRSGGDITKVKDFRNLVNLLQYALECNSRSAYKSDGTRSFDDAATLIMSTLRSFEMAKTRFQTMMSKESTRMNSKKLVASFYRMASFFTLVTGDLLYSNSLKANFDYNAKIPTATNVYFEYDSGVIDEMLVFVQTLNSSFNNGKIFTALGDTLQEALTNGVERIALNEGVMDTAFALISHFKTMDLLLLWPLYITRAITYWVGFIFVSVHNLQLDVDESLRLRSSVMTKKDYDSYHTNAQIRGEKAKQAFTKANIAIESNAVEDKKALQKLQGNNASVLI